MKARILPANEWAKVEGLGVDLAKVLPYVEPQNIALVVVEDGADGIVACLAAVRVTHLEGTWIAPAHRKKAGVLRALLREAFAIPQARGEGWAFGCPHDGNAEVARYLERLGGVRMPVALYALPMGGN